MIDPGLPNTEAGHSIWSQLHKSLNYIFLVVAVNCHGGHGKIEIQHFKWDFKELRSDSRPTVVITPLMASQSHRHAPRRQSRAFGGIACVRAFMWESIKALMVNSNYRVFIGDDCAAPICN